MKKVAVHEPEKRVTHLGCIVSTSTILERGEDGRYEPVLTHITLECPPPQICKVQKIVEAKGRSKK